MKLTQQAKKRRKIKSDSDHNDPTQKISGLELWGPEAAAHFVSKLHLEINGLLELKGELRYLDSSRSI